jgi:hypothetical protein
MASVGIFQRLGIVCTPFLACRFISLFLPPALSFVSCLPRLPRLSFRPF